MSIRSLSNKTKFIGAGDKGLYQSISCFDNIQLNDTEIVDGNLQLINKDGSAETNFNSITISSNTNLQIAGNSRKVAYINGVFVTVVKNTTGWNLFGSVDGGNNWNPSHFLDYRTTIQDVSLAVDTSNNKLFIFETFDNAACGLWHYDVTDNGEIIYLNGYTIDSGNNLMGGCSISVVNSEIHMAWSHKNLNSYNLRYRKGIINADNTITFDAIVGITNDNNVYINNNRPNIILNKDNKPIIIVDRQGGESYIRYIYCYYRTQDNSSWVAKQIYDGGAYNQQGPSAIFVPQSINGLANGRIWVSWAGPDSIEATYYNIRVSYSDDDGSTWSTPKKITSGNVFNQMYPTITANKDNKIFVLFQYNTDGVHQYSSLGNSNDWGEFMDYGPGTTPSALFDLSLKISKPIFTYKGATKVGLYGTYLKYTPLTGNGIATIQPADLRKWGNIKFDNIIQTNSNISVDILDTEDNIIKSNIKTMNELSDISIVNKILKVKFTLNRTNTTDISPSITNPNISWMGEDLMLDETTGIKYRFKVVNGELELEEA